MGCARCGGHSGRGPLLGAKAAAHRACTGGNRVLESTAAHRACTGRRGRSASAHAGTEGCASTCRDLNSIINSTTCQRCNTLQHSPIGVFRHHAGIGDDVWQVRVWAEFCRSGHTASALPLLSTHGRADSLATAETARSHGHDAADNANAPVFENESMCVTPRGPATSRKSFSLFDLRSCAHAGRRRSTPDCRCVAHAVWSLLHNMCCAIPVLHTPPRTLARCAEGVRLQ